MVTTTTSKIVKKTYPCLSFKNVSRTEMSIIYTYFEKGRRNRRVICITPMYRHRNGIIAIMASSQSYDPRRV